MIYFYFLYGATIEGGNPPRPPPPTTSSKGQNNTYQAPFSRQFLVAKSQFHIRTQEDLPHKGRSGSKIP